MRHIGLLRGEPTTREALGEEPTVMQSATDPAGYLMAPRRGFFEAVADPMATVVQGQLLGRIHNPEEPYESPVEIRAPFDGVLSAARSIRSPQLDPVMWSVRSPS